MKSEAIKVEIVKETAKAYLVKDSAGREGWIQRRWLRADGTVIAATFERSAASKIERQQQRDGAFAAAKAFRNEAHRVSVARETEKAIGVTAVYGDGAFVHEGLEKLVWFPKSQVREGKVPGWLILAKARELGESLIGGCNHLSILVESVGGVEVDLHVTPARW
jgi:hypothetical protein